MKRAEYAAIRRKLKSYTHIKRELELRTAHISDFRKILINPLPETEKTLKKIYYNIIVSMEKEADKLRKRLNLIDSILDELDGNERSIIYYRYIEGIDWLRMPEYMMYEQRNCQIIENKALEKIAKMDIDWSVDDEEAK